VLNGKPCSANEQCRSGLCIDDVCCSSACSNACSACDIPGSEGTCTPVPAGQDPDQECAQDPPATCARDGTCDGQGNCRRYQAGTQCAAGSCTVNTEYAASTCDGNGACMPGASKTCVGSMCMGNTCASSCASAGDCQNGFYCDGNKHCAQKKAVGDGCGAPAECASNYCVDGVCCGSPCTQRCNSCNLPGSVGTCTVVPAPQDPRNECPAEAEATCGRAGGCNGSGTCRLHPPGTVCQGQTCSASLQMAASTCNGLGVCTPGAGTDCTPYVCGSSACVVTCGSPADCKAGFTCLSGVCTLPGLVLYWKLDDAAGTTATDSSGGSLNGNLTPTGATGAPTASAMVAPVGFTDPFSRVFDLSKRQAIQLAPMPAALKPANNITLSAWYKASAVDNDGSPTGSEIMSGGNQYILRVRATQIEFSKRIFSVAMNKNLHSQCFGTVPNHLDGNWHHLAGLTSPTGMKLYFDGVERCSVASGEDIVYDQGTDFWVGRHGNGQTQWDFGGSIDEVRVYNRALSPVEITWLAQGKN
jgi:hypothetical protein